MSNTAPQPTAHTIELDVSTDAQSTWLCGCFSLRLELAADGTILAGWSLDNATGRIESIPTTLARRIVGCPEPGSAVSSVAVRMALLDIASAQEAA